LEVSVSSAVLSRDIVPGAQSKRRDDARPAGSLLGGKDSAGRFCCDLN
jgi:hypothetical protein